MMSERYRETATEVINELGLKKKKKRASMLFFAIRFLLSHSVQQHSSTARWHSLGANVLITARVQCDVRYGAMKRNTQHTSANCSSNLGTVQADSRGVISGSIPSPLVRAVDGKQPGWELHDSLRSLD